MLAYYAVNIINIHMLIYLEIGYFKLMNKLETRQNNVMVKDTNTYYTAIHACNVYYIKKVNNINRLFIIIFF